MTTTLLLLCYVALQASFIWARYSVFRVEGTTPRGVRLIEASTLMCIGVAVALVAGRDGGQVMLDAAALVLAGASAGMFGWGLRSVQRGQLSAAFSGDVPVELLRNGAFGFVRNPFYLAYLLAHALPLLASRSVWAALPLAWMALLYHRAARMEERKFLDSPWAEDWHRYAQVTGRFLPRIPQRHTSQEV